MNLKKFVTKSFILAILLTLLSKARETVLVTVANQLAVGQLQNDDFSFWMMSGYNVFHNNYELLIVALFVLFYLPELKLTGKFFMESFKN